MSKFSIGDGVRQKSTEGTGHIIGVHPTFPPSEKTTYTIRFNLGGHQSIVPESDLEPFIERRSGMDRRVNRDRRQTVVAKDQGQCVLESLSRLLTLSVTDVRKMFADFSGGPQDPSLINQVADVLIENGYVVGQISHNRIEQKGECCLVVMHNNAGSGHAVAVFQDNKIFDSEHKFNENGGDFHAQCLSLGWKIEHVLTFRKL